ncbi:MAG: bifunctional metallophosphatase/5'-nucleotidase [Actinoallomurus sp.]
MTQDLGRRTFLTATGATAAMAAIGTPAYATEDARDAAAADEYVDVQLLNITDLHGYLHGSSVITGAGGARYTVGGVGYLAAHLNRLRDGHRNSIFFGPGDMFSGWEFDAESVADESTVEALNRMDFRFSSAGNHEFDKSPAFLTAHMERGIPFPEVGWDDEFVDSTGRRFRGAKFRYYSANVVWSATGRTVVPPYNIEWVDAGGGRRLPIGFIHLTAYGTETFPASFQPALRTLDEVETVNRYAALLKARGVNAIILSMHDGAVAGSDFNSGSNPSGPAYDLARQVSPDVDAIVTGHWHCRFNMMVPDPNGVPRPFVEAGYNGQLINEINLRLDRRTGKVIRELTVSTNHPNAQDVAPDPELQEVADYWLDFATKRGQTTIGRVTGSFTRTRNAAGESTMGDLAADWAYWSGRQPIDPTNDGNAFRNLPADLALIAITPRVGQGVVGGDLVSTAPDGAITRAQAFKAVGYGDPVVTATVTGQQIHDALEQQWTSSADGKVVYAPFAVSHNVRYTYDAGRPVGDRVDPADVLIDGERLDLKRNYRLATMAYTFVQGDGYPALAEYHRPVRQPRDFENFVKFVRTRKVLTPAPLDRVAAKNAGLAAHAVEVPAPSDEPRIGNNLSYGSFQIPC